MDDACSLPRVIIARLTGRVTTKATASEPARASQKRALVTPASMAPGTETMAVLSTTSMTAAVGVLVGCPGGGVALVVLMVGSVLVVQPGRGGAGASLLGGVPLNRPDAVADRPAVRTQGRRAAGHRQGVGAR
ncbi:hypothetical protein FHR93_003432 [Geodermatophilus sabuli]|uniref:Uncharacterized protein n=1 Tax=Geodermatophilus sabuli TaxID=1564158 RepID=A0A285E8P0_9ACTN|nr:hypothetical protein [Geodermatophilus sabuli]SNX95377.1 hypothetical protein SAMN06893097_10272 [Geodermatophilus sabuli]